MEALNEIVIGGKSPIFKKVSEISDISALSREERMKYDYAIKVYRDNIKRAAGLTEAKIENMS